MEVECTTSQQEPEISRRRLKAEEEEEEHEESVLMIEEEEEEEQEQDRETGVTDEEDNRNNNIVEEGAASETTQESENEERLRHRPSVVIPKPRIEPLLPSFFASEPLHHHALHLHSTTATNRKRRLGEERREGSTSAFKAVARIKPQGEEEREGEEEESSSSSSSSSSARWYHSASAKRERRSDDSKGTKVSLPPLSALSECASLLPPISSSSSSLPFIPSAPSSSSAPNRPLLPPLARPQPQPKLPEVHPSASAARSVSFPPAEDQQHHIRRPSPSLAPPQRDDFQRMYPYLDKDQLQVLVSSFMQTSRVQQSKDGSPMAVAPHEVAAAQLLSAWQKHTSKLSSACSSPSSSASFTYGEGVQLEERRKMGYAHHRERPGSCSSEDISSFRSFLQQQLIALKRQQQEHQNAGRPSPTTTNDPNLQHIHNLLSMRLSSSAVSASSLTSSCAMPSTSVSAPLPPSPASVVASSSSSSSSLPMELLRERASSIQSPENLQEYLATFTENMREISEIKHNKLRNKLLKQQKGAESNKKIKKGRRKPRRLKGPQVFLLEEVFKLNPVPNSKTKQKLAEQLGVSNRRIQVWFQNRRAKVRKISKNMTTPSPSSSSSTTTTSSTSTATTSSFSDAYVSSSSSPSSSRPASPTRTTTTSTLPMSLSSLLSGAPLPLSPSASSSVLKA